MPNKKIFKVGIAGYGVVGKRRRKYISKIPYLNVVAVCDNIFESDGQFEDGVKYFCSYKQLIQEKLDILFVCLPNYLSPEVTIAALQKSLHVFCEKPPGRNVEDIIQVIETEKNYPHLCLKYGFNHRYHHSIKNTLRIIQSKKLGKIINIKGTYGKSKMISYDKKRKKSTWRTNRFESGGGILLDQGIHLVDMIRLFAGEFAEVYSFISNNYWNYDVEDNAYALMKTDTGIIAMIHSSATLWKHSFKIDITLEKGLIALQGILSSSKSYGSESMSISYAAEEDNGDPYEESFIYNDDPSWLEEVRDFSDSVINKRKITMGSSREALKTMELVYKIYEADKDWHKKYLSK